MDVVAVCVPFVGCDAVGINGALVLGANDADNVASVRGRLRVSDARCEMLCVFPTVNVSEMLDVCDF